jgi:hypothetical protein
MSAVYIAVLFRTGVSIALMAVGKNNTASSQCNDRRQNYLFHTSLLLFVSVAVLSVMTAFIAAEMSGVMGSIVLVQTSFLTARLGARFVRLKAVVSVPVIVEMPGIGFAVMRMGILIYAAAHRIVRNTSDSGKSCIRSNPAVVVSASGKGVFTACQRKNHYDQPHKQ